MTKDAATPQQYWSNTSHGENLSLTLGQAEIMMQYFFTKIDHWTTERVFVLCGHTKNLKV
jgi:hypothetical protein